MFTKPRSRYSLVPFLFVIALLLSACSAATIDTPQGKLKVESLEYLRHDGTFYANDPHRLVLTLTRSDNEMFSVDDLNYIIHSDAYITDSRGKKYSIAREFTDATFTDSQTEKFRLEFSGKPEGDREFTLYWPDNGPIKINREKHYMLDN